MTETWLRQRKFAKQIMDTASKSGFYGYPAMEAIRLLYELGTGPQDDQHSLESFVARVTCRLAWSSATASDELQQRARELLIGVSPAGAVGNRFPTVMSLPTILSPPKAWEMRRARTEKRFFEIMADKVAHSVGAGSLTTSWMRQYLENRAKWGFESDLEGASAVGMHGIAGALTIAAPMQSFCLAMCHHPQYQSILHEEIDRVCGDEMPSYSRIEEMPVLRAFIRETMRWRPPVPTGMYGYIAAKPSVDSNRYPARMQRRRRPQRVLHPKRINTPSSGVVNRPRPSHIPRSGQLQSSTMARPSFPFVSRATEQAPHNHRVQPIRLRQAHMSWNGRDRSKPLRRYRRPGLDVLHEPPRLGSSGNSSSKSI